MPRNFCISVLETLNRTLLSHLIRDDGDEDLTFALWSPSRGSFRDTALLREVILPIEGDRQRHGNVSYNIQYFKRVCKIAIEKKMGICFIHSHPCSGWQEMSSDDIDAEKKMAPTVYSLTDLPLVGMTVGNDGTWSARIWELSVKLKFKRRDAMLIKIIGMKLTPFFNYRIVSRPEFREEFKRTRTVYGATNHERLARLTIGIVGLGSVGSIVAEQLARMGIEHIILIDSDIIKAHNLDRQLGALRQDIGSRKVDVAKRQILSGGTGKKMNVEAVPFNISDSRAYQRALDCDVIFSCVDRPLARYVLNHIAYSHLIPVIDGGIRVAFDENENFESADWQIQTIGPGRPCLQCLKVFDMADVSLEKSGMLEKPSYMQGLPNLHPLKNNQNIFPFSCHLASFEVFHLMALVTGIGGVEDFSVQRYRYKHGYISTYHDRSCNIGCSFKELVSTGDEIIKVI